ncbi:hypothetical protein ZIOFF_061174 [Zingiber officinale]|uniref:Uncharacterized protein n=1 Tax=Zingiber officinale TaxID=94328 RepID=A0A8J5F412_ZINOF|nr:hypothetical protein ZIOFF_061174 [Zingiber officinale]
MEMADSVELLSSIGAFEVFPATKRRGIWDPRRAFEGLSVKLFYGWKCSNTCALLLSWNMLYCSWSESLIGIFSDNQKQARLDLV